MASMCHGALARHALPQKASPVSMRYVLTKLEKKRNLTKQRQTFTRYKYTPSLPITIVQGMKCENQILMCKSHGMISTVQTMKYNLGCRMADLYGVTEILNNCKMREFLS